MAILGANDSYHNHPLCSIQVRRLLAAARKKRESAVARLRAQRELARIASERADFGNESTGLSEAGMVAISSASTAR